MVIHLFVPNVENYKEQKIMALVDYILSLFTPYGRNAQYAKPGPYKTELKPSEEVKFNSWVKQNNIPFDPTEQNPDYDMRGFWKAMNEGKAQRSTTNFHFPDTFKTPYHKSFSNESMYALPNAPSWKGNDLVDKDGKVVYSEEGQ